MKKMMRWLPAAIGCALLAGVTTANAAYPDHTVRLLIGYEPGGATNALARLIAAKLSEKWNEPVVVDSRPGADGTIAADIAAHAAPDGYTMILATASLTLTQFQYKLDYDPIKSFAPAILIASQPDMLVVNPSLPVNTVKELIDFAKSKPGKLNYGSTGVGGPPFYMEMQVFMQVTGTNMVNISYKGGGPNSIGLLGNEVQLSFAGMAANLGYVKDGKLKALAISGVGNLRSTLLPDVPTVAEAAGLPTFDGGTYGGILFPAGTPSDIVTKTHDNISEILKDAATRDQLINLGFQIVDYTPEQYAAKLKTETATWAKFMKSTGAK